MIKTIQQLIDTALVRPEREGSGKFKPSKFGCCYRQQIWARRGEGPSNPPDERSLRVFKAGNLFEDFVKGAIMQDDNGWIDGNTDDHVIECEDVKGYADLIGPNEVCDIKSQHSKSFWWKKKELQAGKDIRDIVHHNWMQLMYYARELGKQFGRLCFCSKDDLCIAEYVQKWDDYWKEQLDTELAVLRDFWADGILPPAEPRLFPKKDGSFGECSYCDWQKTCKTLESEK